MKSPPSTKYNSEILDRYFSTCKMRCMIKDIESGEFKDFRIHFFFRVCVFHKKIKLLKVSDRGR